MTAVTKYDPETMPALARQKMREGWTRGQLAAYLGVNVSTLNRWARRHPLFLAAQRGGADFTDAMAEECLLRLATGYEYVEVTEEKVGETVKTRSTIKQMPPNVTALTFWLKNRRPARWKANVEPVTDTESATWAGLQAVLREGREGADGDD